MNSRDGTRRPADRATRIEVLRLQARYERMLLRQQLQDLSTHLSAEALTQRARIRLEGAGVRWLSHGLGLVRRYPRLFSLLLAWVPPGRRARSVAGLGLGALLVWRSMRRRRPDVDS